MDTPSASRTAVGHHCAVIVALFLAATLGGLVLLWLASDQFVVGASSLAARLSISPLVVGVVVMGFGTSAPELVVSAVAALSGSPEVGIGNVVGSNLANLTLVLGVAALMSPLTVSSGVIRREAFLALGATVAFAVAIQGDLHRWEGILLMVLLAGVLVLLVRSAQRVPAPEPPVETSAEPASRAAGRPALRDGVRTLLALAAIVVGADLLVRGALGIADLAGVSGGFVGVTVVALGTSLPELATAIAAARRGETNLIIGNLLGSNLFNALAVGGVVITIAPGPLHEPNLTTIGTAAMVAAALVALAFMRSGHRVGRVEAGLLIVGYVAVLPLLM